MLTTCMPNSVCYKNHINTSAKLMQRCAPKKTWALEIIRVCQKWSHVCLRTFAKANRIHSELAQQLHQALKWFTSCISVDKIAPSPQEKDSSLSNITGYCGRLRLLTRGQLTDPSVTLQIHNNLWGYGGHSLMITRQMPTKATNEQERNLTSTKPVWLCVETDLTEFNSILSRKAAFLGCDYLY